MKKKKSGDKGLDFEDPLHQFAIAAPILAKDRGLTQSPPNCFLCLLPQTHPGETPYQGKGSSAELVTRLRTGSAMLAQPQPQGAPSTGRHLRRPAGRQGPVRSQRAPTCAFGSQPGGGGKAAVGSSGHGHREVAANSLGPGRRVVNTAAAVDAPEVAKARVEEERGASDQQARLDQRAESLNNLYYNQPAAEPPAAPLSPADAQDSQRLQRQLLGGEASTSGRLDQALFIQSTRQPADRGSRPLSTAPRSRLLRRPGLALDASPLVVAAQREASLQGLDARRRRQQQRMAGGAGAQSSQTAVDTAFLASIRGMLQEGRKKKRGSRCGGGVAAAGRGSCHAAASPGTGHSQLTPCSPGLPCAGGTTP